MRLFLTVTAFFITRLIGIVISIFIGANYVAFFIAANFAESSLSYILQFVVLTTMCNHFVRIGTNEIAFQTMEM